MRFMLVFLIMAGLAEPCLGGDIFKRQLHSYADYKILVIKGGNPSKEVDKLVAAPSNYKIVVWQSQPEQTRVEDTSRVMDWVRNGGVLWFCDSRLASHFQMTADPVRKEDLRAFKEWKAEYGAKKNVPGAVTMTIAAQGMPHPVLMGVDGVQIWMPKVGDNQYSCVNQSAGVIPLLRIDPVTGSPNYKKLMAAMVKFGNGTVVFKPLIWDEQSTGERFQANLLEWSAGFGIPDVAGPTVQRVGTTTTPAADGGGDQIVLRDKRVISGKILTRAFTLVLLDPYRANAVQLSTVKDIEFQVDGARDAVHLKDGQKIIGNTEFPEDLVIREASGSVQRVHKTDVVKITLKP